MIEYEVYEEVPIQVVSKTAIGSFEYVVTYWVDDRCWYVTCTCTLNNKGLRHGPFDEAGAMAMVASRVAREEELKR